MATFKANLETARNNMAARLADATANQKPDYSLDGESYSWAGYVQMLTNQLEVIEKALARADGPYEHRSVART